MLYYTTLIPYKFHYFAPHSSFLINTSLLNSNATNFENERAVLMWHLFVVLARTKPRGAPGSKPKAC